jgi:polygalacturonase
MLQDWSYAGAFEGRALPLMTGPIYDAVSYGADPAGTRDSTTAIQLAIDAAGATGAVVYLGKGTYRLHSDVASRVRLRYSNVVLGGAGVGRTFLFNTTTSMRRLPVASIGYAAAGGWEDVVGAPVNLSADVLTPVRRIPVETTAGFAVGDHIVIATRLSRAFIDEVQMTG